MGLCAGEDGNLTRDSESVKVMRAEEKTYTPLFKKLRLSKNRHQTIWYPDQLRKNVAIALMQILRPSRTTYMTTWQVGFIERAIARQRIHWARILWYTTRQLIDESWRRLVNYLSPFFINFYIGMGLLIEA